MDLGINVAYWGLGLSPKRAADRDAGVATLAVIPMAFTFEERLGQVRQLAEIAL